MPENVELRRERRRALYVKRRAAGLCGYCGADAEGKAACPSCNAKRALRQSSAYQHTWQARNRPKIRVYHARYRRKLWDQIIGAYGGRCACCGETERAWLTIDHVNGGGREDRKHRSHLSIMAAIVRDEFPPEFQVMCWNCHMAKDRRGGCPHQKRAAV